MHKSSCRVYYEDTDAGGVVYYANYLKFAERGRTEFLRSLGVDQSELSEKEGIYFVVRNVQMNLIKPAKLDYLLDVSTKVTEISGASIAMDQEITHDSKIINEIKVQIVCVNSNMRPARIPEHIRDKMKTL